MVTPRIAHIPCPGAYFQAQSERNEIEREMNRMLLEVRGQLTLGDMCCLSSLHCSRHYGFVSSHPMRVCSAWLPPRAPCCTR